MKKLLLIGAAGVAVLAGGYLAAAKHAGNVLTREVAAYQKTLADHDQIYVNKLVYEPQLFKGELQYDLAWRPLPDDPLRALLVEFLADGAEPEIRLTGTIPVRHGPWVGGLGWARAQAALTVSDEVRKLLPQYPGQTPWLTLDAKVELGGGLLLKASVIDYKGRVINAATDSTADAELAGLRASLWVSSGASAHRSELNLSRLQFGDRDFQFDTRELRVKSSGDFHPRQTLEAEASLASVEVTDRSGSGLKVKAGPLKGDVDTIREWPFIWTGRSALKFNEITVEGPLGKGRVSSISASSETRRKGELVEGTTSFEIGESQMADVKLPKFAMQFTVGNLEGDALNEMFAALEKAWNDAGADLPDEAMKRLSGMADRLLAKGPSLALDRLALSVKGQDDIKWSFSVGVAPGTKLDFSQLDALGKAVQGRTTLTASVAALEELSRVALQLQALAQGQAVPKAEALQQEARQQHSQWMQMLSSVPQLVVTPNQVSFDAQLKGGQVSVNGKPVDPGEGLAGLAALSDLGALLGQSASGSSPASAASGAARPSAASPNRQPAAPVAPSARPASPAASATPSRAAATSAAKGRSGLNVDAQAAFSTLRLQADFDPDPRRVELTAGGDLELDGTLGNDCAGFVDPAAPDVEVVYSAGKYDLFLYAESSADTALIVRTPSGAWLCNDDGQDRNLDPTVRVRSPASGSYKIWVATIDRANASATLFVSEADPTRRR